MDSGQDSIGDINRQLPRASREEPPRRRRRDRRSAVHRRPNTNPSPLAQFGQGLVLGEGVGFSSGPKVIARKIDAAMEVLAYTRAEAVVAIYRRENQMLQGASGLSYGVNGRSKADPSPRTCKESPASTEITEARKAPWGITGT